MADYELPRIRKESGIFWVEVEKIRPNSMQPRRVFDEPKLKELSESIRQYGVLQPLVVVRHEKEVPGGIVVEYEIIAGERRWRASQVAGLTQVPVIIREDSSEKVKLELALIENLQREDLGPLERAEAFRQLIDQFKMRHHEVGVKIGKSREFVSNTVRLLSLPKEIQEGLNSGLITEGHTRPLMSLSKQEDDQIALYKEVIYRKMTVRETEEISKKLVRTRVERRIKSDMEDPESQKLGQQLSDVLGTRVLVEKKGPTAKKISIEFFSEEELQSFLSKIGVFGEDQMAGDIDDGEELVVEEQEQCEQQPDPNIELAAEEKAEEKKEENESEKEKQSWLKYFSI